MKKLFTLLFIVSIQVLWAQQPYYNDVNLTLTGQELYYELQDKIDRASSSFNYGDVKDVMKITDKDPNNNYKVLLIYGHNDNDGNCTTDRTRNNNSFGGGNCDYNREHVFARSNANPGMGNTSNGSTGIVADPHNLRPSDTRMNSNRGNKKFGPGSGNAGTTSSGYFYPGDEWKGDVARMMMYMYTRYGSRCLPSLNGSGSTQGSTQMLQLYLQWNVDDPVSEVEDQRNPYLENVYGNRNPFIDNPYLATIIWGGPAAEDRWNMIGVGEFSHQDVTIYPNPTDEVIWVSNSSSLSIEKYSVYDMSGILVMENSLNPSDSQINVSNLDKGVYLLQLNSATNSITKKIMVN